MERLREELGMLRMDLERQEALASRRGEVIAELKDKACTKWASGLLTFQCRVSRAFPGLDFNIQLFDEEVEESASEAEVDELSRCFQGPLIALPCPVIFGFLRRPALLLCLLGAHLLTPLFL